MIAGGETLFDYRAYRAAWDERAAELSVAPVVLGPVDDTQLPALVAGAEVFAFPSVKEGFGLAPLEALAAGVPLVVSDLPVFREIFRDAASYAIGPADLARQLRAAPRTDRSARSRALAATYTWPAAAAAHLEFYARVLNTSQRSAQSASPPVLGADCGGFLPDPGVKPSSVCHGTRLADRGQRR